MSPAKSHDPHLERSQRRDVLINGLRPSPLKISNDSHFIHKSSSTNSSSLSSSSISAAFQLPHVPAPKQQQRQPVIIYTHSPKVIHTQARDFMALVQKLTGCSRPGDNIRNGNGIAPTNLQKNQSKRDPSREGSKSSNDVSLKLVGNGQEADNESSSVLTDENSGRAGNGGGGANVDFNNNIVSSSSCVSPNLMNPAQNPFFADIPLFTPNSSMDLFCSPRPVYRFPDSAFASSNLGNSISPSVLEFMRGFPER